MHKFKVQLHTHTRSDPDDCIVHSEKALIDKAAHHNYDVLAITCHNKLVFSDELENYAASKNILLIPGIEKTIIGRHILIVNAAKEAEKIESFAELEEYKKAHPECLIVAPHPFHPMPYALREHFEKAQHLYDAIEWSSFHTKNYKFNEKAVQKAAELDLPLLGTSDNHVLKFLDYTYSYVFADEKTTDAIIDSIKQEKLEIQTKPMHMVRLSIMTIRFAVSEFFRKLFRRIYRKLLRK
ncbi:PHP-associated domain-containing protein [Patescibacteria group bacterium]